MNALRELGMGRTMPKEISQWAYSDSEPHFLRPRNLRVRRTLLGLLFVLRGRLLRESKPRPKPFKRSELPLHHPGWLSIGGGILVFKVVFKQS